MLTLYVHIQIGEVVQLVTKIIVNVHYNNGQKIVNTVGKVDLLSFKNGLGKSKLTFHNEFMHA